MINFLRVLFLILFFYMVYTVVSTSIESNLFKEWSYLANIPWMTATLKDFYVNTLVIFVWIAYKEEKLLTKILWAFGLVFLGSIASTAYMLIQLYKLNPGDSLNKLFLKNKLNKEIL